MPVEPPGWHERGYLPHYDDGKVIQSLTYRLADSLPAEVMAKLEELALDDETRRGQVERYLDAGHVSCVLREAVCAQAVLDAWRHDDGRYYRLHAWVVMPNHVHVLIEPSGGCAIGEIVGAWKSVTARKILGSATAPGRLKQLATAGGRAPRKRRVWQTDYYDRFIRNECHYAAVVDYIHNNPVNAGLVVRPQDWPWSSAHGGSDGTATTFGRIS